ncbi:type I secretion outer membrane protein%2C TolC family [Achromobacter sp. 2789STDY5608621]|nr:type I secretion outer membrane protein%2C TolC family [Achromobacter sp. 2789STDY5608621]
MRSTPWMLLVALGVATLPPVTRAGNEPLPSRPTMPYQAPAVPGEGLVDLTLTDAVFLGLRGNRGIRSAYLTRLAQKFDLRVAEDYFSPKLLVTGQITGNRTQDDRSRQGLLSPAATMVGEFGTRLSLGWTSQLSNANRAGGFRDDGITLAIIQPLLRGARREVATAPLRMARLIEQSNRLALQDAVSQTVTQIIQTYWQLMRAQEQVTLAKAALQRSRDLWEINKALIAAGRMAQVDVVQTEADVATQEFNVENADNDVNASRLALLQLLALDLRSRIRAGDTPQKMPSTLSLQEAQRIALTHQPRYLQQVIAREQADINLVVARDNRLWDVSLMGGASQGRTRRSSHSEAVSDRHWDSYVGVQVQIPLGDLSARQAEVHAKADADNQALLLENAEQQLALDVNNAVRELGSRWRQYEIAGRVRDLSRKKLEIEHQKLQAGRSSNFQVLAFETDLRGAENARLNALISYLDAQAQLDLKLGMTLQSWDISLND